MVRPMSMVLVPSLTTYAADGGEGGVVVEGDQGVLRQGPGGRHVLRHLVPEGRPPGGGVREPPGTHHLQQPGHGGPDVGLERHPGRHGVVKLLGADVNLKQKLDSLVTFWYYY